MRVFSTPQKDMCGGERTCTECDEQEPWCVFRHEVFEVPVLRENMFRVAKDYFMASCLLLVILVTDENPDPSPNNTDRHWCESAFSHAWRKQPGMNWGLHAPYLVCIRLPGMV